MTREEGKVRCPACTHMLLWHRHWGQHTQPPYKEQPCDSTIEYSDPEAGRDHIRCRCPYALDIIKDP